MLLMACVFALPWRFYHDCLFCFAGPSRLPLHEAVQPPSSQAATGLGCIEAASNYNGDAPL